MARVTIDDTIIDVPPGTNLMEVLKKAEIEIPYFCYHPGLPIVAQCRMCLVDVEGIPKVQPACNMFIRDGMTVRTKNEKVEEARRAVMEFLLINHPLDCPICDQAGECSLQDNSFGYGQGGSRYDLKKRQYPGFDRTEIGPHVMADMTRCIQCTKCIRVTEEISETGELAFQERGGRTLVWTHDGTPLDNDLSANAAEVCPVGALTAKEFRFRARVWSLDETNTVCSGCDLGCNMTVDTRDNLAHRYRARENREVNDWWICDHGRFGVEAANVRDIEKPRRNVDGDWADLGFDAAITEIVAALEAAERPAILAPASLSNESLWLATRLAEETGAAIGTFAATGERRRIKSHGQWTYGEDVVPNRNGARLLGLRDGLDLNGCDLVLVLDGDLEVLQRDEEMVSALTSVATTVVLARTKSSLSEGADLILPLASHLESDGTWVNGRGRLQRHERAFVAQGGNRPAWEILDRIRRAREASDSYIRVDKIFDAMAAATAGFRGQRWSTLSSTGTPLRSVRDLDADPEEAA